MNIDFEMDFTKKPFIFKKKIVVQTNGYLIS